MLIVTQSLEQAHHQQLKHRYWQREIQVQKPKYL